MEQLENGAITRLRRRIGAIDPHTVSRAMIGFVFAGMLAIGAVLVFVAPHASGVSQNDLAHIVVRPPMISGD